MQCETDVLIVGGGPAGLATAIALRQRKMDCVVVEAGSAGIDKACGEGLMPDAVAALAGLGVPLSAEVDGQAFEGICFINSKQRAQASFPAARGIGVRRTMLHRRLAERAEECGAKILWHSRVALKDRTTARVCGEEIGFRWLVGADGNASSVRRWAGLGETRQHSVRYGFRQHYAVRPWSRCVEVYWGRGAQVYVTPIGAKCVGVALVTRDARYDRRELLRGFPELAERLEGAVAMSQQRGAVSATLRLKRVADETVALVGDASGSADATTGDGLGMGFRQAHALADALEAGSLAGYERAHRRIGRLPHWMGQVMLTMDRWPQVEQRAIRALATHPELFRELLSVHLGAASLTGFALRQGPKLAWNLLAGTM